MHRKKLEGDLWHVGMDIKEKEKADKNEDEADGGMPWINVNSKLLENSLLYSDYHPDPMHPGYWSVPNC